NGAGVHQCLGCGRLLVVVLLLSNRVRLLLGLLLRLDFLLPARHCAESYGQGRQEKKKKNKWSAPSARLASATHAVATIYLRRGTHACPSTSDTSTATACELTLHLTGLVLCVTKPYEKWG
ncbi:unnamed protein product, partial [Ixodes pacificus]